jgi:hypothetical protein
MPASSRFRASTRWKRKLQPASPAGTGREAHHATVHCISRGAGLQPVVWSRQPKCGVKSSVEAPPGPFPRQAAIAEATPSSPHPAPPRLDDREGEPEYRDIMWSGRRCRSAGTTRAAQVIDPGEHRIAEAPGYAIFFQELDGRRGQAPRS